MAPMNKADLGIESDSREKVLWFSRHEMTDDQRAALGDVEIKQINKSINSAYELIDEINECDTVAIVAPIDLQQQFLKLAGDKPVIMAVNDRVLIPQQDGTEDKVAFQFVKWEQLLKIEVVKQDFVVDQEKQKQASSLDEIIKKYIFKRKKQPDSQTKLHLRDERSI